MVPFSEMSGQCGHFELTRIDGGPGVQLGRSAEGVTGPLGGVGPRGITGPPEESRVYTQGSRVHSWNTGPLAEPRVHLTLTRRDTSSVGTTPSHTRHPTPRKPHPNHQLTTIHGGGSPEKHLYWMARSPLSPPNQTLTPRHTGPLSPSSHSPVSMPQSGT